MVKKKQALGWIEWLIGWMYVTYELLFQRTKTSHLQNPLELPSLNDLTCIVTGTTSGIGKEIARQLAEAGAHVVMAVRNRKTANELIDQWCSSWAGILLNVEVMELDLLSLDSVVGFANTWNARLEPLHVLINNAGIFSIGETQKFSKDGFEEHLQVNHLAPALLSVLLLPSLIKGSTSRIINVNSVISSIRIKGLSICIIATNNCFHVSPMRPWLNAKGILKAQMHYVGFVDTEDMNTVSGKRKYSSLLGYTNSKLAQVMFSSVLHKRPPVESGVNVMCVSPGIVHTNVARDLPRIVQAAYHLIPYFLFSPQEGARSALFAATDPQIPEYCESLKTDEWPFCAFISQGCHPTNPSKEAHSVETSFEVWEKTLEMIGLPSDAVERLIEGKEVRCRYGTGKD
ncbi:hypothetical protein Godav_003255 [Gossypium davidsonii]|uniref:Uncharacterized protein n=1 Tax=Gossypium davidsonii TaxID=34287 RepID=A0A7J8T0C4_GOSDV|nr:hypothetical protein [Gossypium davidsonii]